MGKQAKLRKSRKKGAEEINLKLLQFTDLLDGLIRPSNAFDELDYIEESELFYYVWEGSNARIYFKERVVLPTELTLQANGIKPLGSAKITASIQKFGSSIGIKEGAIITKNLNDNNVKVAHLPETIDSVRDDEEEEEDSWEWE